MAALRSDLRSRKSKSITSRNDTRSEDVNGNMKTRPPPAQTLSKVVSMQKVMIKSKLKVEQIAKDVDMGNRNGSAKNSSPIGHRRQLPKVRITNAWNKKSSELSSSRPKIEKRNSDIKRPASVGLPCISKSRYLTLSTQQRPSSQNCATENASCHGTYIKSSPFHEGASVWHSSDDTETRDLRNYPMDKFEKENFKSQYSNNDLNPVTYTYLLGVEDSPREMLTLRNHGLGATAMDALGNALDNNTIVKVLDLEGNSLNDAGLEDLCILLRGNMHIENLNLSGNLFSSKGMVAISHLLESNKSLTSIYLARNKLIDTDLEILCNCLEDSNNNLQTLDVSYNNFTPESGHILSRFLSITSRLKELSIAGNNFGPEGTMLVFDGLRGNSSLTILNVACNEISDRGMIRIAEISDVGKSLKSLDLSDNYITIRGIRSFILMMDKNNALNILKLDNNHICTNGLTLFLEHLVEQENGTLSQLHARGVFADQRIQELCETIRQRNGEFVLFGVLGNAGNNTNDALKLLNIYLRNNNIVDASRSEKIDSII